MRDYRKLWHKVQCNEDIHGAGKDWKGYDPDTPELPDFVEDILDEIDRLRVPENRLDVTLSRHLELNSLCCSCVNLFHSCSRPGVEQCEEYKANKIVVEKGLEEMQPNTIVVSERCPDCDIQMVYDESIDDNVCPRCGE